MLPESSILKTNKKLLGLPEDDTSFDTDLIIAINSVFSILNQMGVGPDSPFTISDDTEVWDDFMENKDYLEMVKSYVNLKVRLIFDPPTSNAVKESMNRMISELEWRLYSLEEFKSGGESNE